jgi:hypothetical protein
MTFTPDNMEPAPQRIPPRDWRWMPTWFWREGFGRDLLDDAGNLWDVLISIHAFPHVENEKPVRPWIIPDLAFGNSPRSSIHGYKYEDLNVNGRDDQEPRLGGITITLTGDSDGDGQTDTQTVVTDANGEYWFTSILPGTYVVSETVTFGMFPTTPTSYTVTVGPGQELVALPGQSMLPGGDPREVVIGPRLSFGNAFEGSIHGYKFNDLNGDGIWQRPAETPRPGVTIVLTWTDRNGNAQTETVVTDANGEYWFTWLEPGLTYTVREVVPPGLRQTTPSPLPITIGSGQEYVADDRQAVAVQQQVTFPWWWTIEMDPVPNNPPGQDPTPPVSVMFMGLATFEFTSSAT